MTAAPSRIVSEVAVETANILGGTEDWQRRWFLRFTGGSRGSGQVLGDAEIVQDYGQIMPAADGTGGNIVDTGIVPDIANDGTGETLEGKLVRLSIRSVDDEGAEQLTPFWWGVVQGQSVNPTGDIDGQATWSCVGLASVLDQIACYRGWIKPNSGSVAFDPGYLPIFNHLPSGDRSASTMTVNGVAVYVHDLIDTTGSGNKWTARQIIDLLLAGAVNDTTYGWTWAIADPDSCLVYEVETIDLGTGTILDAVNALINARRGMTWYLTVAGTVATINVVSGVPSEIIVGTFTLPASSAQRDFDVTGNPWVTNLSINEDYSSTFDVIEIWGAHPWVGITVVYDGPDDGSLQKGWLSDDETTWDTDHDSSLVEGVWRRLEVRGTWDGEQRPYVSGATGLRDTLAVSGDDDAAYGYGGYTGERSHAGGTYAPPTQILETERMLPASIGFGDLRLGPRQPPIVVQYDGSVYSDVSEDIQAQVDDNPPAVFLHKGTDKGDSMKTLLETSGALLYVSMGFREAAPLKVSWRRNPAEWKRTVPRVKVIQIRGLEQWMVINGTITGVDIDTVTPLTQSGDLTIRDDVPQMRGLLALARARYGSPALKINWTDRGILDTSTDFIPGTLINDITNGARTITANAVITRQRWQRVIRDGVEMWDTINEIERVLPDVEAII